MIKYIIALIALTALLGSIIPLAQYLFYRIKLAAQPAKLLFPQVLLDYDMDDLQYESVKSQGEVFIDRLNLANRGWVRGPHGTVMSDESFEAKKKCEYDIELP